MAVLIDNSDKNSKIINLRQATNCLGNRVVALWIDYLIVAILFIIPTYILDKIVFAAFILPFLYFPVLEGIKGYTPGKLILHIRVVNDKGNPPGFLRAVIRTLLKFIEANPFFLGGVPAGIVAMFSSTHQRLGDMAAGTYVVLAKYVVENNPKHT